MDTRVHTIRIAYSNTKTVVASVNTTDMVKTAFKSIILTAFNHTVYKLWEQQPMAQYIPICWYI